MCDAQLPVRTVIPHSENYFQKLLESQGKGSDKGDLVHEQMATLVDGKYTVPHIQSIAAELAGTIEDHESIPAHWLEPSTYSVYHCYEA
jgi:hypothetical protein